MKNFPAAAIFYPLFSASNPYFCTIEFNIVCSTTGFARLHSTNYRLLT